MKKRVSCKTGNKSNINRYGCWLTGAYSHPDDRAGSFSPTHDRMSTYTANTARDLGIGFNEVSGIY